MTVQLMRGDALDLPLADHSVDLVVTSPPYSPFLEVAANRDSRRDRVRDRQAAHAITNRYAIIAITTITPRSWVA